MGFGFLSALFSGPKCEICGKEAKEDLDNGSRTRLFCRTHLIESFAKDFLAYRGRILLFPPEFEKTSSRMYGFYPLSEMNNFSFNKESVKKIGELLDTINGSCAYCRSEARVLYFPKGFLGYFLARPAIEKVQAASGQLLCLEHALGKIRPDLESNKGFFKEGLYVPHGESGMYVSES
jgi:hypothetical protein